MPKSEAAARTNIDAALIAAGWLVQNFDQLDLSAAKGVTLREVPWSVVMVLPTTCVLSGIPAHVQAPPFLYESTGVETQFTNRLGRDRRRFARSAEQFQAIQADLSRRRTKNVVLREDA